MHTPYQQNQATKYSPKGCNPQKMKRLSGKNHVFNKQKIPRQGSEPYLGILTPESQVGKGFGLVDTKSSELW